MTHRRMKYAFAALLALSLPLILISCSSEVADEPSITDRVVLAFDMVAVETRSGLNPDNHEEEAGFGGELTIYSGKWFNVYIHDSESGRLVCHFTEDTSLPSSVVEMVRLEDGRYRVKIATRSLVRGKPYRLSVMANCIDSYGNLYAAASAFHNSADSPTLLQSPHYMPFSGFRIFTLSDNLPDGATLDIGRLSLLRGVSRIDVNLSDDMQRKWKVESAVVENASGRLYSTCYASPREENVATVDRTELLTSDLMFNPRRGAYMADPSGSHVDMLDIAGDGGSFRVYLPEQENPLPGFGDEIKLRLVMQHRHVAQTRVVAYLYLRDYPGDTPINLVRNHIYRFNVRSVKPLFDFDIDILAPSDRIIDVPSFD